jgi:D-amino-acid dehydrogenase
MSRHVLVVGGGVIGLCSALYARRRGFEVTVLDREDADADRASAGNAGLVTPSHFVPLSAPGVINLGLKWMLDAESPFYIKPRPSLELIRWGSLFVRSATHEHVRRAGPLLRDLNVGSRREYEALADELDDFGLQKKGLTMLCQTREGLEEEKETAEHARTLGVAASVLTPEALAEREPDIRMEVVGGVHYPGDCHMEPARFLGALRARLRDDGVRFRWNTPVTGWRTRNGAVLAARTPDGDLHADEYVVAGGSWTPELVRPLKVRLPLQPGKGYNLTLPDPPARPTLPAICMESRFAVTPMGSALRIAGTMELAGFDGKVNEVRVRGIQKGVMRFFPDFTEEHFAGIEPWFGYRPCSPDGLPFLGRPRRHRNLIVATGHAMLGLSLGPISGRLVGELLAGEEPSIDLTVCRPDRFD